MATTENTSTNHKAAAAPSATTTTEEFNEMALRLNIFGALLAGIEEICRTEDIGGDALNVAATICGQINHGVCTLANQLDELASKGGAA